MSRILGLVDCCKNCPNKLYYSGGLYECKIVGQLISAYTLEHGHIAEWCPLPPHPAMEFEAMRAELIKLRASVQEGGKQS